MGSDRLYKEVLQFFTMAEGRRSQVLLLDERRLDILIQPKLYAGDLLDMVSSHFNLKEKEYFGLAYQDETGHFFWLQMDRRVLEHDFPKKSSQGNQPPLMLYFLVKYFVEHISQLRDSSTVEAFYLQAKSLVAKGSIEADSDTAFRLAALVLQATHGDYISDCTAKSLLKKLPVLPTSVFSEHPSLTICEDRVVLHYKDLVGQSRGAAIVKYMSLVEALPTYGIHYYQVKDKGGIPWWLGLSHRGLSQYDHSDRKIPRKVFLWKQLENLYFRDRKFSIEVHDAKRVVHTLSSFNLYEDAIEEPLSNTDELSDAICDPTTQVSVSRRTFGPGNVTVFVWLASSPNLTKCIWSMAIAQHQFYLDRKHNKSEVFLTRNLGQIAVELSRSSHSLSSSSCSTPILSRSTSTHSLPSALKIEGVKGQQGPQGASLASGEPQPDEESQELKEAREAMLAALRAKRDALQDILNKKLADLKGICLTEGEITGELPPETPLAPGEAPPQVRRRMGTSFMFNDKLMLNGLRGNEEEEVLSKLELNFDIQSKIASAAWKLANDMTSKKSLRRQRKVTYQQAQVKLKEIEKELIIKRKQAEMKKRKAARKCSDDEPSEDNVSHSTDGSGISQEKVDCSSLNGLHTGHEDVHNQINRALTVTVSNTNRGSSSPSPVPSSASSSFSQPQLSRTGSISAPASPSKHRNHSLCSPPLSSVGSSVTPPPSPVPKVTRVTSRQFSMEGQHGYKPNSLYQTRHSYRNQHYPTLPLNSTKAAQRKYSTESEYDNVSVDSGSCILKSPYQNRFESSLNTEGSNLYSVQTQRTSQALDTKDDLLLSSTCPNRKAEIEFGMMSRHNSLDSMRRHSFQRTGHHLPPSPLSSSPRTPTNPRPYTLLSHTQTLPVSQSFDDRLGSYGSCYGTDRTDSTQFRRQQSYNQPHHLNQWQNHQTINSNFAYAKKYHSSLNRQSSQTYSMESRSLDALDCEDSDNPVFEDISSPNSKKAHCESSDGLACLPPHPKSRGRLDHRNNRLQLQLQMQSQLRPSTLPLLPKNHQNIQRHLSSNGEFSSSSMGSSVSLSNQGYFQPMASNYMGFTCIPQGRSYPNGLSECAKSDLKPVSVVHPHQWLETSLDDNTSSTYSPLLKTNKKWTETSLDSPAPMRRSKSKEMTGSTSTLASLASLQSVPPHHHHPLPDLIQDQSKQEQPQPTTALSNHLEPKSNSNFVNMSNLENKNKEHKLECHPQPNLNQNRQDLVIQESNYSNGVEVDVVSVGHFQPYWEETKPYEISDFYKYSTKHRTNSRQGQNTSTDSYSSANDSNSCKSPSVKGAYGGTSTPVTPTGPEFTGVHLRHDDSGSSVVKRVLSPLRAGNLPNSPLSSNALKSPNSVQSPDGSFTYDGARSSVADAFHEEMLAWYEDQEHVKRATLV